MKRIVMCVVAVLLLCPAARAGTEWPAAEIVEKCDELWLQSIDPDYLRIMRNGIFATYGREFSSQDLKEFFADQYWYKVNPDYSEDMLSEEEKACAERIAAVEEEVKQKIAAHEGKERATDASTLPGARIFGDFDDITKKLIAENGFAILPTREEQLFNIYENNAYQRIPSFVTADSVLQLYHIFFDFSLRKIEQDHLLPQLAKLTMGLYQASIPEAGAPEKIAEAANMNAAYFAVAAILLEMSPDLTMLPPALQNAVEAELVSIQKHEGRMPSNIFPYSVDYSQFIPRGHYTRTEELRRFFLSMMWLGNTLYAIDTDKVYAPSFQQEQADQLLIRSMLIANALHVQEQDNKLLNLWHGVYDITTFFVGKADDLSPEDIYRISVEAYGGAPSATDLTDAEKLEQVRVLARKMWNPGIIPLTDDIPTGPQMRVMGQRYIPDSEMLQKLSSFPERPFPRGLDVMAVLGSDTARDILVNLYKAPATWPAYQGELDKLIDKFGQLTPDEWRQNMYFGWLWTLQALADARIEGKMVPYFATTRAWDKKNLNTALGSWAELRHDTILYGKQSSAECGAPEEFVDPPAPRGYVEPNVEFFSRLEQLTRLSIAGLERFGYIKDQASDEEYWQPSLRGRYNEILDLIVFLKDAAQKQLDGTPLTGAEYSRINAVGGALEWLTRSLMDGAPDYWELVDEADRFMAVIADVHTGKDNEGLMALEEGVGYANEILVVIPDGGTLRLARGAVFSYYEFKKPVADRLTDEKWQQMLKNDQQPDPPEWLGDIMNHIFRKMPEVDTGYYGGC